jgi:hypothetical protein
MIIPISNVGIAQDLRLDYVVAGPEVHSDQNFCQATWNLRTSLGRSAILAAHKRVLGNRCIHNFYPSRSIRLLVGLVLVGSEQRISLRNRRLPLRNAGSISCSTGMPRFSMSRSWSIPLRMLQEVIQQCMPIFLLNSTAHPKGGRRELRHRCGATRCDASCFNFQ